MLVQAAPETSVFRNRSFLLYWLMRVSSSFAVQMQGVAVGWQIYDMTDNAFDLGLIGLAQFLPLVLLLPITGPAADRYNRRMIVQIGLLVCAAAIAVLAIGTAGGWLTSGLILAVVCVFGGGRAFQQSTQPALIPMIVPPAQLSRAVAATTSAQQIAVISGPALGGVLYAISPPLVYIVSTVIFLLSASLLIPMRLERAAARREPFTFEHMFAGFVFIRRNPILLGAITIDLFAVVLGGVTAVLPIFAKDVFDVGPEGLGVLQLSPAIGALTVSIVLSRWMLTRKIGASMFGAVAVFGLATIVFGLSKSFALTIAALAVMGAADMVSVVIRETLVQLVTPDFMRGRVNAVHNLFTGTSNEFGRFRAGLTAGWLGTVQSVALGGLAVILVVLWGYRAFPQLARIDRMDDVPRPSQ